MIVIPNGLEGYQLLHDGSFAFARAERAGIRVDLDYCRSKQKKLTRKIDRLHDEFIESDFFRHWKKVYKDRAKITSDHQLAHLLYDVKKIDPMKFTTSGRGAVDEEALRNIPGIPELAILIQLNKLSKLRDVNLEGFIREADHTGFIHPFFNLNTVVTYRSSSDRPNFQNIPKRDYEAMMIIRKALYARYGHQLLEVDFSGMEVRVAACYHKDPVMLKYIKDPRSDMHADMATQLLFLDFPIDTRLADHYTLRQSAKNAFVFPQFYGDYYKNCAYNIACGWLKLPKEGKWKPGMGIELPSIRKGYHISDWMLEHGVKDFEDFQDHVKDVEDDFWNNRFKIYNRWKDRWYKEYLKKGYFDTLTGFRCSGMMSKNDATNYPVQGSAFHCLLWTFIQIDRIAQEEGWDSRLIGQVHDSMVLDILPEELKHVIKTITMVATRALRRHWDWIMVPMEIDMELCDIDHPWSEKKELKEAA